MPVVKTLVQRHSLNYGFGSVRSLTVTARKRSSTRILSCDGSIGFSGDTRTRVLLWRTPLRITQRTVVLAGSCVLVIGALVAFLIVRDPLDPLTPENLAGARKLWRESGIRDYDFRYEMSGSTYDVFVREGGVRRLLRDGASTSTHSPELFTVEGIFEVLDLELDQRDKVSQPSAVARPAMLLYVRFNAEYGYVERFIRVVGGSGKSHGLQTLSFSANPATSLSAGE